VKTLLSSPRYDLNLRGKGDLSFLRYDLHLRGEGGEGRLLLASLSHSEERRKRRGTSLGLVDTLRREKEKRDLSRLR